MTQPPSGLTRSNLSAPGITRAGAGHGFGYTRPNGQPVIDTATLVRISALAIPPAWRDVWIAPEPNWHIQAIGTDRGGIIQYRYHAAWRREEDALKFARALELAAALPDARTHVSSDLDDHEPSRQRAQAAAFRMLDTASLRVGSERYADEHGSYGLTTLRTQHATVRADTVHLAFTAKSHHAWESTIPDASLARVIRSYKRRGSDQPLLAHRQHEIWHPLHAADVNAYLQDRLNGHFSAKDFRTLHGTIAAAQWLATAGPAGSPAHAVSASMRAAAEVLENTPAVARASYVDPRVIERFESGITLDTNPAVPLEHRLRALLLSR
ncbi:DNA topoisomerase IB [Curtobacterium flaccumfaciens pv. flaccumfaciens]|uniref:DNA topoisomerase IB n=1 Tax=Curtobacterium flaccumfaciens TaxID=2035 RepID=UPI001BCCA86B|nr:DNA topoisomerase IB [Curtobacterium flaccumfaciens]QVG65573.1 DNA topoisomerase IB [Curtobacterium flaccumfaciens pv. flaccumfaciens]